MTMALFGANNIFDQRLTQDALTHGQQETTLSRSLSGSGRPHRVQLLLILGALSAFVSFILIPGAFVS